MKMIATLLIALLLPAMALAYSPKNDPEYSQDSYNRWTRTDNLDKDTDGDGRTNRYDSSDRNPNKW